MKRYSYYDADDPFRLERPVASSARRIQWLDLRTKTVGLIPNCPCPNGQMWGLRSLNSTIICQTDRLMSSVFQFQGAASWLPE